MIRWTLKLSEFNYRIEHRPGETNVVADALSRAPVEVVEETVKCQPVHIQSLESKEELQKAQESDPEIQLIRQFLMDPDSVPLAQFLAVEGRSQQFKLIDGLVFYTRTPNSDNEYRVYVPEKLRKTVLQEFHDCPLSGHMGVRKTYARLRDACYFPNMRKFVVEYVSSCDICQKFNYKNVSPAGTLISSKASTPNEIVGLDLIGPYPLSNPRRNRYVLVMVDYFTKWVELVPLRKASAQAVASAFFSNFISKYGCPQSVVSDNGPQFISEIFENLCQELEIKHIKTVPYRPQANQTERVNRNLVQMIAAYIEGAHTNWDRYLPQFAFALRTAVHDSTGKTPAELFLGRKILTPFQRLILSDETKKQFIVKNMDEVLREAREAIKKAQKGQAKYYNLRRRENKVQVGDWALVETHHTSNAAKREVGKFFPKFQGPYKVIHVKDNNVILKMGDNEIKANVDQVKKYHPRAPPSSVNASSSSKSSHRPDASEPPRHDSEEGRPGPSNAPQASASPKQSARPNAGPTSKGQHRPPTDKKRKQLPVSSSHSGGSDRTPPAKKQFSGKAVNPHRLPAHSRKRPGNETSSSASGRGPYPIDKRQRRTSPSSTAAAPQRHTSPPRQEKPYGQPQHGKRRRHPEEQQRRYPAKIPKRTGNKRRPHSMSESSSTSSSHSNPSKGKTVVQHRNKRGLSPEAPPRQYPPKQAKRTGLKRQLPEGNNKDSMSSTRRSWKQAESWADKRFRESFWTSERRSKPDSICPASSSARSTILSCCLKTNKVNSF